MVSIRPRTTVVVLAAAVYITNGVPLAAGSAAKLTTLNVFAIVFPYPKAIARATAESAALASVNAVSTLTSILLSVPPSLTSNSSVVARPEVRAVCPDITLLFNMEPSTEVAAIVTTPAFVIVTSPDKAAAVNQVPSPINICMVVSALAETTPELLASLTKTVFAA